MEKNRKIQIIEAAIKRFNKHGLSKTTLDEVARDLRIGKATIYHYFDSKDELYFTTLNYRIDQYIEDIKNILTNTDKPHEERLMEYFEYKTKFDETFNLIYDLMLAVLKGNGTENEIATVKNLLSKEKELMQSFTKENKLNKSDNKYLPEFMVIQSWGFLFGQRLKSISNTEAFESTKEISQRVLKNILN